MSSPLRFWIVLVGLLATLAVGARWILGDGEAPAPAAMAPLVESSGPLPQSVLVASRAQPPSVEEIPQETSDLPEVALQETASGSRPSVFEASERILASTPSVFIVFSPGCSLSRRAFPGFLKSVAENAGGLQVLAFATDEADPAEVGAFLEQQGAPFSAEVLQSWQRGEFTAAMASLGIAAGSSWTKPLIGVLGADGRVLGQWQGGFDPRGLEQALRAAAP